MGSHAAGLLALPDVNHATIEINIEPFQLEDFSASHSRVDCHHDYVVDPFGAHPVL
jgi:hypothetical protein